MIVSHLNKFIMFLPWKTASQTLVKRLANYDESPYSKFFSFNPNLNRVIHQHLTCSDFCALPEAQYKYYLASFVRNPYDRVYSGFLQIQRDILYQPNMKFTPPWIKDLVISQLNENKRMLIKANNNFDNWVELIDEYQIYEEGRNTNLPLHPSHYWTHIANIQYVNFIGKVENFEVDIKTFANNVNISNLPTINANVTEQQLQSKIGHKIYKYTVRMNSSSIKKINFLFSKDFELFDYQKI